VLLSSLNLPSPIVAGRSWTAIGGDADLLRLFRDFVMPREDVFSENAPVSDVITGHDGKSRCVWAGADDTAFVRYHDEVWGTRTYDESALFEALTLGVFEVGLSWSIVFGKRDAFRKAFRSFAVAKVAAMTERDVDRLVQDASIIRNRAKIQATVDNARAMLSASPSLAELAKSYESTRKRAPRSLADLPTSTPQAEALAKQLKSQGYRFVGPTSVYAFMQNVGVVNDHIHGCFRATDYERR
jgi:DNA-3-methyladenine glycosylase I